MLTASGRLLCLVPHRKQYRRLLSSVVTIQKNYRAHYWRRAFLRLRLAALVLQKHRRGQLGRSLCRQLRAQKEEEERRRLEEEERRKRMEEEERRRREEEEERRRKAEEEEERRRRAEEELRLMKEREEEQKMAARAEEKR